MSLEGANNARSKCHWYRPQREKKSCQAWCPRANVVNASVWQPTLTCERLLVAHWSLAQTNPPILLLATEIPFSWLQHSAKGLFHRTVAVPRLIYKGMVLKRVRHLFHFMLEVIYHSVYMLMLCSTFVQIFCINSTWTWNSTLASTAFITCPIWRLVLSEGYSAAFINMRAVLDGGSYWRALVDKTLVLCEQQGFIWKGSHLKQFYSAILPARRKPNYKNMFQQQKSGKNLRCT